MSQPFLAKSIAAALALAALACGSAKFERARVIDAPPTAPAAAPKAATLPAPSAPAATPSAPAEKPAPGRSVPQYTIEQFLGTVNVNGASFSPDSSKILVSSDESGVLNAYAVPVAGGPRVQLTRSTGDSIVAYSYFPRDERFLYGSDRGGNEITHVYVQEADGSARDLTPGDKVKAVFLGWSADKQGFFIGVNERDPRFFDVYEYATDGYTRKLLYQDDQGLNVTAISPDRRYLAMEKTISTSDSDTLLYDTRSKTFKNLTEHPAGQRLASQPHSFSPSGTSLYYTTDRGHEFAWLARYDLVTGEHHEVLRPDWDVAYAGFSEGNRYLIVAINNDARTELRLLDAKTLKPVELPRLPDADLTGVVFNADDSRMAFYADTSRAPRNLHAYDFASGRLTQLTQSLNPAIDPTALVEGKVVRFKSWDGLEVPGLLYRPHQADAASKVPALVWVHGGPGGQTRLGYNALLQYLVNHGYAVYAINNRGSSGYGKTFFGLDDRKHGADDLGDCVASKKMLTDLGYVQGDKIGIIGGSYGGYMVLAALAFQPREFAVGVDLFGVANWVRTLQSIPAWWESFRNALYQELGNPETDLEYLKKISPLFHADRIERPLIVLQGANDPRVLKVESDEIVAAVRKKGVPVEYVVFDDEGHGFVKKVNQEKGYKAILAFLDQHLRG